MRRPTVPDVLCQGPFTLAQAEAAGLSPRMLQSQAWRRLFRGVYVHGSVEVTPALLGLAVRLVLPEGAVVAGRIAAALQGLPTLGGSGRPLEAIVAPTGRSRRFAPAPGGLVRVRTADLAADDVRWVAGVPVTSPARTALDIARTGNVVEVVVMLDAVTGRGLASPEALAEYVARRPGARGIRVMRRALLLVEPASESPMETRLRLVLVLGGLPAPVVQHRVIDPSGLVVARLDLAYPEHLVGIEYDGAHHGGLWQRDLARMYAVMGEGWWLRRYTSTDVFDRPGVVLAEVAHALGIAA